VTPDAWRTDAACQDLGPDLFFPLGTTGPAIVQTITAKQICRSCPVRRECLIDALGIPACQDLGIRGGLTEGERVTLRQTRRAAAS
jgi:WhiB family redox-sensing transcriptional regulator